jgi:hypothetical protein
MIAGINVASPPTIALAGRETARPRGVVWVLCSSEPLDVRGR